MQGQFREWEPLVSMTYAVVESFVIKGYGPLRLLRSLCRLAVKIQWP